MSAEEIAEVVKERFGSELEQQRERARGVAEQQVAKPGEAGEAGEDGEATEMDGAEADTATTRPRVVARGAAAVAASGAPASDAAAGRGWRPWLGPIGGLAAIGVGLVVMSQLSKQPKHKARGGAVVRVVDAGADATALVAAPVGMDAGGAATAAVDAGRARPSPTDTAPRQVGYLSIDSTPYAVITLDGKTIGETPIIRRALPVGRHKLTARLQDGRTRKWTVDVVAGVESPTQLAW